MASYHRSVDIKLTDSVTAPLWLQILDFEISDAWTTHTITTELIALKRILGRTLAVSIVFHIFKAFGISSLLPHP